MADKRKQAKEQVKFCKELMDRLNKSVEENANESLSSYFIPNRSQISNDIIRLRRELSTLSKLMNPYD